MTTSSDTYRIVVDSSQRMQGHPFDFLYDISRVTTARDFVNSVWMVGIEWSDPVKYSERSADFSKHVDHASSLLLQCPDLLQLNSHESWTYNVSSTLALLQGYVGYGYYGITADTPYLSKKSLGVVVQGDRLNALGSVRFRVMQGPSLNNPSVRPCVAPDNVGVFGEDYSFSLVFWKVHQPTPERPNTPLYDVYKLWLSSTNRISGTPADCSIPIVMRSTGMTQGKWEVAMESWSLFKHDSAVVAPGMIVTSSTFSDENSNSKVLGKLGRSYRNSEEKYFGLRLTTKPPLRDTVGVPVTTPVDALNSVQIGIRDSVTASTLSDPADLHEWVMCLVFYRVDK